MTHQEAIEFMKSFCKGKGPMREEKWAWLVQKAYEKGKQHGINIGSSITYSDLSDMVNNS